MITRTYVVKMAGEGEAISSRDFVSEEINKVTFVRPVNVLCIDRDVPDSRFMREDLYDKEELDKTFERGLRAGKKEGWNLARSLMLTPEDGGIGIAGITAAFGDDASGYSIMRDIGIFGAEQMYKEWRKAAEKPFEVGDIIVNYYTGSKAIVTAVEEKCFHIVRSDGTCNVYLTKERGRLKEWTRTGEKADVGSLLNKIKRDNPRWNGAM